MTVYLTKAEKAVIRQVLLGLSNEEISQKLLITVPTVKKHIGSIMTKTTRQSRARIMADYYLGHYEINNFILEER